MSEQHDAEPQRTPHSPQHQRQDGQRPSQSQWQGGRPPATPQTPQPTTADPGADGQSVYDVQDAESRERAEKPLAPPWKSRPDSNAI